MDAETLLLETEESMLKAVDFAKQEFSGVRTGKALSLIHISEPTRP